MRDKNIDAAKGMAIVLVVMGHVCTGIPGLVKWIYSFHMPLFFLISGYLQEGKGGGAICSIPKEEGIDVTISVLCFCRFGNFRNSNYKQGNTRSDNYYAYFWYNNRKQCDGTNLVLNGFV